MNSRRLSPACSCPACSCRTAHGSCPEVCSARVDADLAAPMIPRRWRAMFFLMGVVALFAVLSESASACEIKFGVDDQSQGPYPAGATVIFRLRVDLTHNNCPVDMKETKIQGLGLNILGATPWQSPSPNVWERRIKVTIAPAPAGNVTLSAKRSCDKDGGWGTITVASTAVKL